MEWEKGVWKEINHQISSMEIPEGWIYRDQLTGNLCFVPKADACIVRELESISAGLRELVSLIDTFKRR